MVPAWFAQENSVPIGAEFNEANYQKVFGSGVTNHLLLFTAAKAEGHQELTAYFKKVAKEFKGKVSNCLEAWRLLSRVGQIFLQKMP